MNVVSVTSTYPTADWPARGRFIRSRLEAMARRFAVRVVAPRPWFPARRPAPGGAAPGETLATRRPSYFCVPGLLKPSDPWFYAHALTRCLADMRQTFSPHLLDAHYEWPDAVAVCRTARRLHIPFSVTIRGKIATHAAFPWRRRQMRDMLRRAATRIAVCRFLADRAAQLADDGRPVHVIPNGIDPAVFRIVDRDAARDALGLAHNPMYLVSIGYVQELKGFHRVVEVLPEVRRRAGDVRLLLIGDEVGEHAYVRRLEATIDRCNVRPHVHRARAASAAETAAWLNAADAFVLATRAEGWCNAIHEALACGTPVVATDVGGNRELVRNQDQGRLVPFGDPAALRDALVWALTNTWQRPRVAASAAARSWDQVAGEVHALFQEVMIRDAPQPRAAACPAAC